MHRHLHEHFQQHHRHDFGPNFPPFGFGPPTFWRGRGRGGPGGRAPRGNVRAAILALLTERPMHGYEIISELEQRTNGLWRPSPGSVYPTLQLLEDEGLVISSESEGKRRFSITDAGQEQVDARAGAPTPWDEVTAGIDPASSRLRDSIGLLIAAITQAARAGTPSQVAETMAIIDEARRRIYGLLASGPEEE